MKKIIYWLLLLAGGLSLAACKKTEMMQFEGVEGVYFAVDTVVGGAKSYTHISNIRFIAYPDSVKEITARIKVMITGPVKDYDRPFVVEINPDSTTAQLGVQYAPLTQQLVIPANSTIGYVPVTLKRSADLQLATKTVGLRLVPNQYFGLSFPKWVALPVSGSTSLGSDSAYDASLHTIAVNDLMVQPAIWYGSIGTGNKDAGSWGAFTRKKIELIFVKFNVTYADFASAQTMPLVFANLITSEMTRYLINQFNAGTPVKEDDGRLMYFSGCPWTSVIGVPYP